VHGEEGGVGGAERVTVCDTCHLMSHLNLHIIGV